MALSRDGKKSPLSRMTNSRRAFGEPGQASTKWRPLPIADQGQRQPGFRFATSAFLSGVG
jgi:hypothetical protein